MPEIKGAPGKRSVWSQIPTVAKAMSGIIGAAAGVLAILASLGVFDADTAQSGKGQQERPPPPRAVAERRTTRDEWAKAANEACQREAREFTAMPISDLLNAPQVTFEELQKVLHAWPQVLEVFQTKQNAVQEIPRPARDTAAIERMLTLWDQAATSLTRAGEAGQAGQWQLYGQLYTDATNVAERANEIARQLGATDCRGL